MQTVSGQVVRFLDDPQAGWHGLVLDNGQVVRFPTDRGHLVYLIITVGSHIGVEGSLHTSGSAEQYWEPSVITNFDSQRSVSFLAPNSQARPGMLPQEHSYPSASPVRPSLLHHSRSADPSVRPPVITRSDAAASISESYDSLHRVQAILAYLRIMKRNVPGIGQLLDEAKHTYGQALSRYQSQSYFAATEFAAASAGLSRVVEILISRNVRTDDSLPSLVPPPPDLYSQSANSTDVEEDLAEAESVLSRIHWLLEHGTLPLEDRTQVRRIASWADALFKQAQHSYRQSSLPDAMELAHAALAGADSAEHICRKWYVAQSLPSPERASQPLHS